MSSGKNIYGVLTYNENKVSRGVATCIAENLYGKEVSTLKFNDKLRGLENFAERNRRATTKAVHLSLNFHPDEKLDTETLTKIAAQYMEGIGFANQPYLVYQHHDAGHPHIHIVTTPIDRHGKRIILFNIGKNQSEKVRKEIEQQFNLVVAGGRKAAVQLRPVDAQRLHYGKAELHQAISRIVRIVTTSYKFTSLAELNAVLQQYNVVADRGKEGSRMYDKQGLVYSALNLSGQRIGIPLKASAIYGKPTLSFLKKKFKVNEVLRLPHKAQLKEKVDAILSSPRLTQSHFIKRLNAQYIAAILRKNAEGKIYGVTFVDNRTKTVFNGSDLGKAYSAKALLENFVPEPAPSQQHFRHQAALESDQSNYLDTTVLDQLITAEHQYQNPLNPAVRKRKKKKRRKL